MGGGDGQGLDVVLLLQVLGVDAPAAPALGAVGVHGHPLDVALVGQGKGTGLLLDEVLDVDLVLDLLDFRLSLVAELVPNLDELLPENGPELGGIRQKLQIVADLFLQLVVLILQLFPVQALEGFQAHIQNGLGLDLIQTKPVHQALFGVVVGGTDDVDDLVNVVLGNEQTFQQVGTLPGLAQVVLGPAGQDLLLMLQVFVNDLPQGQDPRLHLVIHQGQHDDAEAALQGGLLEQVVENHLGIGVLLQLNNHAHTVAVRLVPQVGDALQTLVLHLVGDVLDELALVDLVGKLRHHNAHPVLAEGLKLRPGPDHHLAPSGGVGRPDAAVAHDDAAGGEIRSGDMLHQIRQGSLRIVQHADAGVDDLRQVVRRDIGGHANGDA